MTVCSNDVCEICGAATPHEKPLGLVPRVAPNLTPGEVEDLFRVDGVVDRVLKLLGTDEGSQPLVTRGKAREVIRDIIARRVSVTDVEAWGRVVVATHYRSHGE